MSSLKTDLVGQKPEGLSVSGADLPTPIHRKGIKDKPLFTHGNWQVKGSGQMGVVRLEFRGEKRGYARMVDTGVRRLVQTWTSDQGPLKIPKGLSLKILLHLTNHGR